MPKRMDGQKTGPENVRCSYAVTAAATDHKVPTIKWNNGESLKSIGHLLVQLPLYRFMGIL